jgi:hypothetical protein
MTGDLDPNPFELRRDARRRFTLTSSGTVLAAAEAVARRAVDDFRRWVGVPAAANL